MKKQLLFLFFITVTFGYAQELLVVDLSTTNEITVTATTNLSAATVSGSDTTGFYLEDFFASAGEQEITNNLVVGTLTSFTELTDDSPNIYRNINTDPGLNIWSYTDDATSNFTAGAQAFSGTATWTLTVDEYNAMLTAPTSGNIYFSADSVDDLGTATLIGTYSVIGTLSISDVQANDFTYYPNPVKDALNISSQKVIEQVEIYNMLGQYVSVQKLNVANGMVNTNSLAKGAYFFRATFQDGTIGSFKVIKE